MNRINPFPWVIWAMFAIFFIAGYFIGGALNSVYKLREMRRFDHMHQWIMNDVPSPHDKR